MTAWLARNGFPEVSKHTIDRLMRDEGMNGLVRGPVLTLVVARGGLVFSGGNANWLDAAIFVPDGKWVGNGGYNILGTLFTNDLSLGGNETFQLDPCFVRDLPATLLHIESVKFSQDDSRDLN